MFRACCGIPGWLRTARPAIATGRSCASYVAVASRSWTRSATQSKSQLSATGSRSPWVLIRRRRSLPRACATAHRAIFRPTRTSFAIVGGPTPPPFTIWSRARHVERRGTPCTRDTVELIIAEKPSVARDLARVLGLRPAGKAHTRAAGASSPGASATSSSWRSRPPTTAAGRRGASTRCRCCRPSSSCARRSTRRSAREGDRAPARPALRRGGQRLRRGPRGRADLSLRLRVRGACASGEAAVDLVAHRRGHPRRLRGAQARRAVRRARRRGARALGGRLAGRHERHPRGHRCGCAGVAARRSSRSAACRRRRWRCWWQREREIREFVPRDYWEVHGTFATAAGERFSARWTHGRATRLGTAALAGAVATRSMAHGGERSDGAGVERVQAKSVREPPPMLFDLTSLQRTANRRFGFSAQRTLDLAQALYERHKLLTYPRTDSRHLTADVAKELPKLFAALGAAARLRALRRAAGGARRRDRTGASSTTPRSPITTRSSRRASRCDCDGLDRRRAAPVRPGRAALPRASSTPTPSSR